MLTENFGFGLGHHTFQQFFGPFFGNVENIVITGQGSGFQTLFDVLAEFTDVDGYAVA